MADTTGKGTGDAGDAEVSTTAAPGTETQEEHDAAIRAKLREEADALVESAKTAIDKQKDHLEGAEKALKDAEAARAALEE